MLDSLLSWPQGLQGNPYGLEVAGVSAQPGAPPLMTVGHWPSRKEAPLGRWRLAGQGRKKGTIVSGPIMAVELASGARLHRCFGNIGGQRPAAWGQLSLISGDRIQVPGHALCVSLDSPPTLLPQSLFRLA